MLVKVILSALGASVLLPVSAFAACGPGQPCLSWTQASSAPAAYQAPQPYYSAPTSQTSKLAGLGPGESLCPTTCPVSVEVPEGGKVLDCYKVCKTVQAAPKRQYQLVRVVRPVIYVQRPAVYHQHGCRTDCKTTRYGY